MVGAVLVYEDRVIGEGYHRVYGQAHAEVNCVNSVAAEDVPLISRSTMYVSLEPCAHFGKTPPCADLILRMGIPKVVVGCRDPFPQVNGKGIEKLLAAGVEVKVGVLEAECMELNRRFFTFNTLHRPYIVLKWAQSANGRIAGATGVGERVFISNEYTNRLVHKWRSEEAAILVGTRTALADDPSLTVRLWSGPDPIRLVIDKELTLPATLKLFDGKVRTIVFNMLRHEEGGELKENEGLERENVSYYQLANDSSLVHQICQALYQLKIQSVLVEGGARLLQSFIDEGYWDEARVITNNELELPGGLPAPVLSGFEDRRAGVGGEIVSGGRVIGGAGREVGGQGRDVSIPISHEFLFSDTIRYYKNL
jgi:diaminohydroxyphosphoribosylaminopyrimidine deaminase/5-amino-6-(5-phosphoribosylamino)uracil reductase